MKENCFEKDNIILLATAANSMLEATATVAAVTIATNATAVACLHGVLWGIPLNESYVIF